MCNDYAREIELGRVLKAFKEMDHVPPFAWRGAAPNEIAPQPHIKISDKGLVATLDGKHLSGDMVKWAWKTPTGKPVFNFVSEGRDFSMSKRGLILATSFYEYTDPKVPKGKLKDQHQFKMRGEEWFWVAGIIKEGCFAMLTDEPGPDVKPYHDRQICLLKPEQGMDWLNLSRSESEVLKPLPKGSLEHRQLVGMVSSFHQANSRKRRLISRRLRPSPYRRRAFRPADRLCRWAFPALRLSVLQPDAFAHPASEPDFRIRSRDS